MVAVFPNVCLWRRSLCSDLVLTIKNCVEPPSYARTAYVVAIWPSFLFDSFVKIWATCEVFLGKWFTAPPGKKFPVRLCLWATHSSLKCRTSSSRYCSNWPGHFRSAPKFPFTTDSASLFSSWNVFPKSFRVSAFQIRRCDFDFSRFSATFMEIYFTFGGFTLMRHLEFWKTKPQVALGQNESWLSTLFKGVLNHVSAMLFSSGYKNSLI